MGIDAEMFVRTRQPVSDDLLRVLNYEVAEAFGAERFWIWNSDGDIRRAIERVTEYEQDGDTIYPEVGETFLRLNPCTRYYGEGYTRGDLPFLIALAEWMEIRVPDGEVWYGGDSSGVCASPFGRAQRERLFRYFAVHGHRPYTGDPRSGTTDSLTQPVSFRGHHLPGQLADDWAYRVCDFCAEPMMRNAWGSSYARLDCYGCGRSDVTNDSGQTWKVVRKVGGTEPPKATVQA